MGVGLEEEKGVAEVSVGSVPAEFALGPDGGERWVREGVGVDLKADFEGEREESGGHGTGGDRVVD